MGLLKKKFFRHGYRKYKFPQSQGKNRPGDSAKEKTAVKSRLLLALS
jgi:hypothetical protein